MEEAIQRRDMAPSLSDRTSNLEEELTAKQFSIILEEFDHCGRESGQKSLRNAISTEDLQIVLANVLERNPGDKKIVSLSSKASLLLDHSKHTCIL